MSRRSLPIVLVLLAGIATAIVWVVSGVREDEAGIGASASSNQAEASGTIPHELVGDASDPTQVQPTLLPASTPTATSERERATSADFDPELAVATWVEGRVIVPAGT